MAISDKLTKLSTDITNAYSTINTKGGTIPANKNTDNLATAINSIPVGSQVYNDGYFGLPYAENLTIAGDTTPNLNNLYKGSLHLKKLYAPNLTTRFNTSSFDNCTALEEIDLPLQTNSPNVYGFRYCSALKKVNVPKWESISQGCFQESGNITECDFSSVTTINANAFLGTNTKKLTFEDITTIGTAFQNSSLEELIFNSISGAIPSQMCQSCSNLKVFKIKTSPYPTSINAYAFIGTTQNTLDIYVPWAEGAIAGAPWGATNATIHYNYTEGGNS